MRKQDLFTHAAFSLVVYLPSRLPFFFFFKREREYLVSSEHVL